MNESSPGAELSLSPEINIDPKSLAVVTTTFYPKWYPGERQKDDRIVDKVRGDLALQMLREANLKGFQTVVVDGANNQPFKEALVQIGVTPKEETERGMSGSRRQGFREASQLPDVKVICWAEPEKVSITRDCLPQAVIPILKGEADIVVPKRTKEGMATLPDYQAEFETESNRLWNLRLRKEGLLQEDVEDLDVWFGPRFFKNDPEIFKLFTDKYEFEKTDLDEKGLKYQKIINPESYPNATFFPVVAALNKGYKVVSVEVPYRHPAEQTAIEQDSAEFRRKRQVQQRSILFANTSFIKMLQGNDRSRTKKVS
jgi:hypothetical protein